eukprot:TRINITY_DN8807_c0_g1_i3.p1 TRINITY_DN8807_c0_g1~~TRINITY_DN8807_c0_g1_i3.p1  ORF type:complete len:736 (-),score=171.04 TRINITY_DN8807_c0_g1_i3:1016-3223(-)
MRIIHNWVSGWRPPVLCVDTTASMVISLFLDHGDMKKVCQILIKMLEEWKVEPNVSTYKIFFQFFLRLEDSESVDFFFMVLNSRQWLPTDGTLKKVIDLNLRENKFEVIKNSLVRMKVMNIRNHLLRVLEVCVDRRQTEWSTFFLGEVNRRHYFLPVPLFDRLVEFYVNMCTDLNNSREGVLQLAMSRRGKGEEMIRLLFFFRHSRELAQTLFNKILEWRENYDMSVLMVAFNTMLEIYGRLKDVTKVKETVQKMVQMKTPLNIHNFTNIVNVYVNLGEFEAANFVIKTMLDNKISVNVVTLNVVLEMYARTDQPERTLNFFRASLDLGFQPCAYTYSILINMYHRLALLEEAESVLLEMRQRGIQPTVPVFNQFINVYAKLGEIEKVKKIWQAMRLEGLSPDQFTYNTAINMFANTNQHVMAEFLFERMTILGIKKDVVTYTTMISMYRKANDLKRIKDTFLKMVGEGNEPNEATFSILFHVFSKLGDVGMAEFVFRMMQERGIKINQLVYHMLMNLYSNLPDVERAMEVFKIMSESGIKPNSVTYNTLINMFSKTDDEESMELTFNNMLKKGLKPDLCTFSAIICRYSKSRDFEKALLVFNRMKMMGLQPDTQLWIILINLFCSSVLSAGFFLKEISGKIPIPDHVVLMVFVKVYEQLDDLGKVSSLLNLVGDGGFDGKESSVKFFLEEFFFSHTRDSETKKFVLLRKLFHEMERRGFQIVGCSLSTRPAKKF